MRKQAIGYRLANARAWVNTWRRVQAAGPIAVGPMLSSWEYGAMYDISDLVNTPNTFLVNLHPHTWRNDKYKNADGSGAAANINTEGGQVVIVRGVAK